MNGSKLISLWLGEEPDPLDSPYSDIHNQKNMLLQVQSTVCRVEAVSFTYKISQLLKLYNNYKHNT